MALFKNLSTLDAPNALADDAWQKLDDMFEHPPEFTQRGKPFQSVISALALKAWSVYERNLIPHKASPETPLCIRKLQQQRDQIKANGRTVASASKSENVPGEELSANGVDLNSTSPFDLSLPPFADIDLEALDFAQMDDWGKFFNDPHYTS